MLLSVLQKQYLEETQTWVFIDSSAMKTVKNKHNGLYITYPKGKTCILSQQEKYPLTLE
uniref:Uncharacterized protein n=1 Tax=Arion vulgaris TaxID=1028688 RepID=A0A0B6Y618_9EUPU